MTTSGKSSKTIQHCLIIVNPATDHMRLTNDPDETRRNVNESLRSQTLIANAAIEQLCRYFYHEVKVQKNKIDDYEELIRARKADIRNLQRGCTLKITKRQADLKIAIYRDAIYGCRAKRNEFMAMNRKIRNKTPLEKYTIALEDDSDDEDVIALG